MSHAEWSVCQFFNDDTYEHVRRYVSEEVALAAFHHYTTGVGAQCGVTTRVIITDGSYSCCFEWQYGKGVTYSPRDADGRLLSHLKLRLP